MMKLQVIMTIAVLAATGASAVVFYEENFEPIPVTNTVSGTVADGKIRFGGNSTALPSMNADEYAIGTIPDNTGIKIEDDGSGTNNVLFVDGRYDKTYGGAVVIDPDNFGGTASVARLSFDLKEYIRKGGDGTACFVDVYAASGYDLTGVTDARIVLDLINGANTPTTVFGVNGSAQATLLATKTFDHTTPLGNLDLSFSYDGTSAIVIVWESQFKSAFKVDNIQISDDGVIAVEGDPAVVFFGGDAGLFDDDAVINNQFVGQTDAGHIVQWNGVDSDGGSFGASGSVVNKGVGAALTNTANDLILTTLDIVPAGSNTFSSGLPNVLGVKGGDDAKFDAGLGEAWTFEFNRTIELRQLVIAALDSSSETVRVTVDGVDTNSFTYVSPDMTNLAWEASANKYIYTYPTPVTVPAGTDITIEATTSGAWGLQGIVVDVPSILDSLSLINFGGNQDLITNATYQSELGGDAIIAWWGGDDDGRFLGDVGTLKDQGVGATLTSVKFDVSIETLAINSTNPAGTTTFVSGGSLGITGGDNAKLDSSNEEAWTLQFDTDVYLYRVGLKGFTGGAEVADIIFGGVTNSIGLSDVVPSAIESGLSIYTFADPVFIAAGTDIEIRATAGQWGVGNLVVGVDVPAATPASLYAAWVAGYPSLGAATNLTDNLDGDSLDNLYEYAQGGDPTDPNDTGIGPDLAIVDVGGTNYFSCTYYRRSDAGARGLVYDAEIDDDLILPPSWTNAGNQVVDGSFFNGNYNYRSVTNLVPSAGKDTQFFQLTVEYQ
jgi:hypothetical protein